MHRKSLGLGVRKWCAPGGAGAGKGWWEGGEGVFWDGGGWNRRQNRSGRGQDQQQQGTPYPKPLCPQFRQPYMCLLDFQQLYCWCRSKKPHRICWGIIQAKGKSILYPEVTTSRLLSCIGCSTNAVLVWAVGDGDRKNWQRWILAKCI